jgi:hypothetical protein
MKNLLILAALLLTFGFANAQCFIYSTSSTSSYGSKKVIGKIEDGGRRSYAAAAFMLLL